jgi:hypothetical protein
MIHPQCFKIEWIRHHNQTLRCVNPFMLEKAIVALQLLAHLAQTRQRELQRSERGTV